MTDNQNTIKPTEDIATKARKTANRAIQRLAQGQDAVSYLRDATGGYSISEHKQEYRNLVLSLVPPELADAFKNHMKQRAEYNAKLLAEAEARWAEQKKRAEYRQADLDRWIWGGEITRGIKAFYNGYPENERETVWVFPVCRTEEELEAKVAEWIRDKEDEDTIHAMTRHVRECDDEEEDDDDEEEELEISDSELVEAYFHFRDDRWNRDYELEVWDREADLRPDNLIAAIKRALADNEIGGMLSKENRVLALERCLNDLNA